MVFPNNVSVTRDLPSLLAGFRSGPISLLSDGTMKVLRLPTDRPRTLRELCPGYCLQLPVRSIAAGPGNPTCNPGPCSAGVSISRPFLGRTGRISQLPGKPSCPYALAKYPGRAVGTRPFTVPPCCPRFLKRRGPRRCVTFGIDAQGLRARCLRFMPSLPMTMQDSLPAGGQPLRGGFRTHSVSIAGFHAADSAFLPAPSFAGAI